VKATSYKTARKHLTIFLFKTMQLDCRRGSGRSLVNLVALTSVCFDIKYFLIEKYLHKNYFLSLFRRWSGGGPGVT
jgi:hypothetical protein